MASPAGKWTAGIAASVIAALLVWWLTHPGGPLNPQPPPEGSQAVPKIVDFNVTDTVVGQSATGTLTVFNEGDSTATACSVWWYSGSEVGNQLEQGLLPQNAATSGDFGLRPGESRLVTLQSLPYTEPGSFRSIAEVSCSGVDVVSEEYHKFVTVNP